MWGFGHKPLIGNQCFSLCLLCLYHWLPLSPTLSRRLIKLTSPNLNNIIVLGVVISYLSALTFFYPRGASTTGIAWGCNVSRSCLTQCPSLIPPSLSSSLPHPLTPYYFPLPLSPSLSSSLTHSLLLPSLIPSFFPSSLPLPPSSLTSPLPLPLPPSLQLRAWSVSLGFSVCYGTLNVKMWRVYAICRNPKPSMSKTVSVCFHYCNSTIARSLWRI